jgi:hypothetical protein
MLDAPSGMPTDSRRPISTRPQPTAASADDQAASEDLRRALERLHAAPLPIELLPPVMFRA